MTTATRILERNEQDEDKSRYLWVHTLPDHYFLAEGYCLLANSLLPKRSAYDFFEGQAAIAKKAAKISLEDQPFQLKDGAELPHPAPIMQEEMAHLSPQSFLLRIDKQSGLVPNIEKVFDELEETRKKKKDDQSNGKKEERDKKENTL